MSCFTIPSMLSNHFPLTNIPIPSVTSTTLLKIIDYVPIIGYCTTFFRDQAAWRRLEDDLESIEGLTWEANGRIRCVRARPDATQEVIDTAREAIRSRFIQYREESIETLAPNVVSFSFAAALTITSIALAVIKDLLPMQQAVVPFLFGVSCIILAATHHFAIQRARESIDSLRTADIPLMRVI